MLYPFQNRPYVALLLLLLALPGCNADQAPAESGTRPAATVTRAAPSPLEQQVLARHDSLMLATGRLFDLRRKLTALRPGLLADSGKNRAALRRLDAATRATLTADDAMTDWMHAYHRPVAGTAPDSVAAYFRRQQGALDQVAALTRAAHDSAQAIYQHLSPANGATRQPR